MSRRETIYLVVLLVTITISMRSTNNMISTTVPLLGKYQFFFNNVDVGVLTAVIFLATLVSTSYINPMLGSAARRRVFIFSNVLVPVSLILFFYSTGYTVWIPVILSGLAYGIITPNIITSASLSSDKNVREMLLSIYSVSLSLSLILGPLLEDYLLSFVSYKAIFAFFLPISMICLGLSTLIKFPEQVKERRGAGALATKGFKSAVLAITTYNIPFAAITSFLAIYGNVDFHLPRTSSYSLFIYFFSVSFATRLFMVIRPFRYLKFPFILSSIITAACLISLPFVKTELLLILVIALLGIPHGTIFPMATILISRGSALEERSSVNSYFLAYNNFLFIAVPIIFGYLTTLIGFALSFLILFIPSSVSAALLVLRYGRDRQIFYK